MYQPFNTVLQFDKHSEGSDAGNNSRILLADMTGHIYSFFKSTAARSASCSRTFRHGSRMSGIVKVQFQLFVLFGHSLPGRQFIHMQRQSGAIIKFRKLLTPDRRCEMRVIPSPIKCSIFSV